MIGYRWLCAVAGAVCLACAPAAGAATDAEIELASRAIHGEIGGGTLTDGEAALAAFLDDHPDADQARRMPTEQLIGSAERVTEGLRDLVRRTRADELMLTAATYDVADRTRSLSLIAAHWR